MGVCNVLSTWHIFSRFFTQPHSLNIIFPPFTDKRQRTQYLQPMSVVVTSWVILNVT